MLFGSPERVLCNPTQPAIFNDLAQEAISLCRASLLNAADSLGAKSAFDGQLFLVRHLLILRDITRNVDLAQKDEPRAGAADAYSMTGGYILCELPRSW